jgi:hypothetical protein
LEIGLRESLQEEWGRAVQASRSDGAWAMETDWCMQDIGHENEFRAIRKRECKCKDQIG